MPCSLVTKGSPGCYKAGNLGHFTVLSVLVSPFKCPRTCQWALGAECGRGEERTLVGALQRVVRTSARGQRGTVASKDSGQCRCRLRGRPGEPTQSRYRVAQGSCGVKGSVGPPVERCKAASGLLVRRGCAGRGTGCHHRSRRILQDVSVIRKGFLVSRNISYKQNQYFLREVLRGGKCLQLKLWRTPVWWAISSVCWLKASESLRV